MVCRRAGCRPPGNTSPPAHPSHPAPDPDTPARPRRQPQRPQSATNVGRSLDLYPPAGHRRRSCSCRTEETGRDTRSHDPPARGPVIGEPRATPRCPGRPEPHRGQRRPAILAILMAMSIEEQMPLAEVKNRLSEVVDTVEREHGRVVITRHGRPVAVVLCVADLESLKETLDVMASTSLMADIRE